MASYYDAYDSPSRPSRRNDSYTQSYYLKPTTGANEPPRRRGGEKATEGQNSGYPSQRSPNGYSHDPRYDYPPPLPPDTGRPPRRTASPYRKRHIWPPQPTCEDEATALAKEAGTQKQLREVGKDVAESRGTVNQETLIEDVPEFMNKDERRFVLGSRDSGVAGLPTPPTSEDEKARKASRRPSKLNMNFNKVSNSVPEVGKRPASPYAFSKSNAQSRDEPSFDRFLSPETLLSPPPMDSRSRQRANVGTRSQPSSPQRDSSSARKDYFSVKASECAVDDADYDSNKLATYPRSRDVPRPSAHTSVVDFAPQPRADTMPIRKLHVDSRRNTDTESTLPTLPKLRVDKSRRPTPLMTSSALSELDESAIYTSPTTTPIASEFPLPRSRESSYVSSRAVSPAGSAVGAGEPAATNRSPRMSAEYAREQNTVSSPTSRNGSVTGSRPSSPSPQTPAESPRLPRTDLDWSALIAANAARRSKPPPPSRLSASLRQESMHVASRSDRKQPSPRTDSLPYPINDGPATPTVWMPSEGTRQYFPERQASLQVPIAQESKTISRSASPSPTPSSSSMLSTGSSRFARPSFQARHSTTELPRPGKRPILEKPKANEGRRVSFNNSSQARKDVQALAKKGLPPCPRDTEVAGYSDWYTLIGAPNLVFCPDCIDSVFERTVFRNAFRPSPPFNRDTKAQCALGGMPWIRLAWLLTLQQQRTDLNLLKDLADIEETSPETCPGKHEAVRSWFGLRDSDGLFVKNFFICYSDVRKIERLLPTVSGLFVRLPSRMSEDRHFCAVRPEGNRFSTYIDALISTHEKALETRKQVDPSLFIELVRRRQRLRECSKDNLLFNGLWHFIPHIPELTVCEDCYETVVEPEVRKNNDLAMRFNRTLQPVYGEGIGSSCQLYSQRMRKVFQRACEDKDMKYLARKAKERREAEMRLQEKYRYVIQKAKRLSWEDGGSGDDERRVDREIQRISLEWQREWE